MTRYLHKRYLFSFKFWRIAIINFLETKIGFTVSTIWTGISFWSLVLALGLVIEVPGSYHIVELIGTIALLLIGIAGMAIYDTKN